MDGSIRVLLLVGLLALAAFLLCLWLAFGWHPRPVRAGIASDFSQRRRAKPTSIAPSLPDQRIALLPP